MSPRGNPYYKAFVERLNGYIRVAQHAETEGARIFKAAGLDYKVEEGLVERARKLREAAAEHSEDGYFGAPWRDEFRQRTVPEQLAEAVDYYNAKRKQHEAEGEKEIGGALQGSAGQTMGCVGNLDVEFDELAEVMKRLEEVYGIVRYFGDRPWIASNLKYFSQEAIKYVREARDLSD